MAQINNLPVYAIATSMVSSLGDKVSAHWEAVKAKQSGIRLYQDNAYGKEPFWASRIHQAIWSDIYTVSQALTPFENLALYASQKALNACTHPINLEETIFILSSTKGNIDGLNIKNKNRLSLYTSAALVAQTLGISNKPVVISHACISGVVALNYALRSLQAGKYKNAIITGADCFTKFVLSGFQSFQAIADNPCRPFDKNRTGINLGEAAGTIILSTGRKQEPLAVLLSGAVSNDANHISGPSRTGAELAMAIERSLSEANLTADDIDMISAHGTATAYNDEMEAKAFTITNLSNNTPLHSFKSYIGHTLGAAGIIESAIAIESIKNQVIIPSLGFNELGVSQPLQVSTESENVPIKYILKTASGFGGCNAAAVWQKV